MLACLLARLLLAACCLLLLTLLLFGLHTTAWLKDEVDPEALGPGPLTAQDSHFYHMAESTLVSRNPSFQSHVSGRTDMTGFTTDPEAAPATATRPKKSILVKGRGSGHHTDDDRAGSEASVKQRSAPGKGSGYTIKLPSLQTTHWDIKVETIVWRVGRHFGFQAFNINPLTKDDVRNLAVALGVVVLG